MKILLLGEYSSLHQNLKEGLQKLGHEAIVASDGDGWRKVPCDISLHSKLPSIFGKLERRLKSLSSLNKMKGFDVAQLMNPFIFPPKYFPSRFFYQKIKDHNNKFFMLAAGMDAYFSHYAHQKLEYVPPDELIKGYTNYKSQSDLDFNQWIIEKVSGVIPIMYEYEVGYASVPNRLPTIPIPINIDKIPYEENKVRKKLVVFHGLNRYEFKGTRHVEEAFEVLARKYPNDLELVIDGKMPLNDYLAVMKRTNVVIDQMYSYSCGMNAIYALAMGKVVLGGAEPESLISLGVDSTPVINLKPNAQSIIEKVEQLLEKRNQFEQLGYESRKFAEEVHDYKKIAQQYIDTWSSH
ncbi:MAG: glycosyltransferase [Nostocales cyanobacterium ELA608]|jgi:glycosyltransferase involved in cell wall biosynthesis